MKRKVNRAGAQSVPERLASAWSFGFTTRDCNWGGNRRGQRVDRRRGLKTEGEEGRREGREARSAREGSKWAIPRVKWDEEVAENLKNREKC